MIRTLVLDTNVLVHCSNHENSFFACSIALLEKIQHGSCKLAVDSPSNWNQPGFNGSKVVSEYLEKIKPTMLAYAFLTHMFKNARIVDVAIANNKNIKKFATQRIRNKRDRTFLCLASSTADKLLTTNDFDDFHLKLRADIDSEFAIKILDARQTLSIVP